MRRPGKPRETTCESRNEAGFTLLELLVVLALIALAALAALPLANRSAPRLVLRSTALEIASQLRATRTTAIKSNTERAFNVDLVSRNFWADGIVAPRPIAGQLAIDVVVPSSEQTGSVAGRLRFFPDGSSSGGRILLKGPGRTAIVTVDWVTGIPRVEWRN